MSTDWNTNNYEQFIDFRTQAAKDLLSAIPEKFNPKIIYDLGCGFGNSTILLQNRFKHALVSGVDSSANMINEAKIRYSNIDFQLGEITNIKSDKKIDLIFANASLHWINHHSELIKKLVGLLNHDGILAFQIPNNFHAPTHQVVLDVLNTNPSWNALSKYLIYKTLSISLYDPCEYYDFLTKADLYNVMVWQVNYYHEMNSYEDIFNWLQGSTLKGLFGAMSKEDKKKFKDLYINAISNQYRLQSNAKILLPFNRLFCIGTKS